jgi:histidine triad (HIT) family protein
MDPSCAFCRIVNRDAPADIVHESDSVLAFRDANPQASTHILLIPKDHVPSARDLTDQHAGVLIELVMTASDLAKAEGVDESGWRLLTNVGSDALQSVHHLHFHLIGGRRMGWPPG